MSNKPLFPEFDKIVLWRMIFAGIEGLFAVEILVSEKVIKQMQR